MPKDSLLTQEILIEKYRATEHVNGFFHLPQTEMKILKSGDKWRVFNDDSFIIDVTTEKEFYNLYFDELNKGDEDFYLSNEF
jgi:hypothetical protein